MGQTTGGFPTYSGEGGSVLCLDPDSRTQRWTLTNEKFHLQYFAPLIPNVKAPPSKGWRLNKPDNTTEPSPDVELQYDMPWQKGPSGNGFLVETLKKLFALGKISLETVVREDSPDGEAEPIATSAHPAIVELREQMEDMQNAME